jgi:ABC-type phosphate transport system substrate-binding protein
VKISSLIYAFRSKVVGAWAFTRYVGRGGINPFSSSGRQLYYYAFLRFMTQQVDRIDVPGTSQKRSSSQNSEQLSQGGGGSLIERQLSKFSSLENIKDRFFENSQGNSSKIETKTSSSRQTVSYNGTKVADHTVDLDKTDLFSEQLSEEEEKLSLLTNRRHIQGRRGRYRVTNYLGQRSLGRLYEGVQINDNKAVIIKEFILPGHIFNRLEIQKIKQEFERLAGVNLTERIQDFRLIGAFEAIADDRENRCYIVTRGRDNFNTTLRDYLSQNGAMTDRQVHGVLRQILQTLEFLHSHKFRLGDANLQRGLTHQNICLDSLLYIPSTKQDLFSDQQFFIYVTDLGIWEHLFRDPKVHKLSESPSEYQPQTDLSDLARLGFHLLIGRDKNEATDQLLDPRNKSLWPKTDEALKQFILQLLGLNGSFDSAEEARLAIPPIPLEKHTIPIKDAPEKGSSKPWQKVLWITGGVVALGLLGGAIWWGVSQIKIQAEEQTKKIAHNAYPCCIQKLDFPEGNFSYGSENNGLWHYVLRHPGLVSFGKTLEAELAQQAVKFKLKYKPQTSLSSSIAKLRNGSLDFVVTTLPTDTIARSAIDSEFEVQAIAYDGIAVFVPFSDVHRDRNLAHSLQGMISFEQLRKLYTGKVENWQEIGGPDLKVKLYAPTDSKLLQIFETQIFARDEDALAQFKKLQGSSIIRADATQTLRDVLNDFEEKDMGSIGFDSLSKVFGQCSVYPLGVRGDRSEGVQALVQDNDKPITPRSDLCDDKGSYWLNPEAFAQKNHYPLKYDLVVIYPKGGNSASPGKKFVDLWRTEEGQKLFDKVGLIPLIALKKS